MRGAPWLLVVLALGCVRPVHVETRETPVEAGLDVPFQARSSRRWDFGDGSPPVVSAQTTHAFAKAGRFVVRGFDGDALREQVSVIVSPRSVFHLVPPDVHWAVLARGLEELPPAVDFAERLVGPGRTQSWLERYPLHGWALDQATAGAQWVDPREGLASFGWEDSDEVRLSVVGVLDGQAGQGTHGTFRQNWHLGSNFLGHLLDGCRQAGKDDELIGTACRHFEPRRDVVRPGACLIPIELPGLDLVQRLPGLNHP
jgi:hypothetical protein